MNWSDFQHLDRDDPQVIRNVQKHLLVEHLRYLQIHSPYYSSLLESLDFRLDAIQSVDDIQLLRLTDKQTIVEHHARMAAVSDDDIVDLCQTSGTTGSPLFVPLTRSDLDRLEWNEFQSIQSTGVTRNDRVLIACSMTRCFMAGLAYYLGVTRLGATAIRAGADNPQYLIQLIEQTRPTAIIGVPSLLVRLARIMDDAGKSARSAGISRIICIGEPVRNMEMEPNEVARLLTEHWGARVFGTYASTEIASSYCECEHTRGGHVRPELCYTEILDEADQPAAPGQWGEVTVTPFGVKGLPLLRFKTGDISRIDSSPCACGRSTFRLAPIVGRKQQMLKIKGCTLYPNTILDALNELDGVDQAYIEAYRDFDLSDNIRIVLSTHATDINPAWISEVLAARFRFRPHVEIRNSGDVSRKILDPARRKPVTFFDLRNESKS